MSGCLGLEVVVVAARLCLGIPDPASDMPPSVIVRCPPLKEYSSERQAAAGRELRSLPKGSEVAGMVSDYGTLRARCRVYDNNSAR